MNYKEIFEELVICKLKGVMFHSEMIDYYAFLDCNKLKAKHHKEMLHDLDAVHAIKDYYLLNYKELIELDLTKANIKNYIPANWNKNIISGEERYQYITEGMEIYYDWEEETCEHLQKLADELFELKHYDDYLFVRDLKETNMIEKSRAHNLRTYIEQIGMSFDTDTGFKYKLD